MQPLTAYGPWALVTGASAGIGMAFARALAEAGMNLVLVARREERLRVLGRELEARHRIQSRAIPLDLAAEGSPGRLATLTDDLEIGVLVNNAGFAVAGRFEKAPHERVLDMVRVNCAAVAGLTHLFLPKMQARGRGAVIIVASAAGYQPLAFNAVYGATKAFDLMLGEALWAENQGSGVDILAVSPGPVETEFQAVAGETAHPGCPPEDVVATALRALGRKPSVIVGTGNRLRAWSVRLAPRSMVARLAATVMRGFIPETAR
jgi:short-subunit dehydrogenase